MNKINKLLILFVASIALGGCSKSWLDVNKDPSNPSSKDATVSSRLPWMQHHLMYAQGTAGARAALVTQGLTFINNTTAQQSLAAGWNPIAGMSTTPYQFFFVTVGPNIAELETKAEAEQAYHYLGAAKVLRAMGFMLMADWYGEMPYTEALSLNITPKFDDGKTIFEGCLADIDKAIEYFNMQQPSTATPLKAGDSWNNGDVNKWLKLCYGLKARWMNNLSKKSSLYKPDEILALLDKAPVSNAESTIVNHEDVKEGTGDPLFNDPIKTSILFDNIGMNTNFRVTKWYEDILTDFAGTGVEDPRADKLIPWAEFGFPKKFVRSKGVDMQSDIRMNAGPINGSYNDTGKDVELDIPKSTNKRIIKPGTWYVNSTNQARWGDTVYVSMKSSSIGYNSDNSDIYKWKDGTVGGSGTFYSRPDAQTFVMTYAEMCFIKAEVYMRKGDKKLAFDAYKAGVIANIDMMNTKLKTYGNINPSKSPMDQAKIDNFVNNGLGSETDISMKKIMTQKYIAMSYSQQNWNDMRRHDYSINSYQGWDVPHEYKVTAAAQVKIPMGKQFRRIMQVSHEINYNSNNVKASHPNALNDDIWSFPVWWDIVE
ncbi:SusD/RagB family nutrient-binding outer membrane lipoprotein [Sphingobacterium faecale]|uniref:SusD/RagB family nutrient-binding outer membrane lipoprotein n=1 Tax=Sphingobacterium faecale TaxID=2803775 RepID=A0ABS1R7X9_9SPHI|nr:SusD/RagB family nutrient-binding outer membrane lipoprotein [Sphingobacterium faecale]MBL1410778.1 SusD/RagB family nutrient-binding outer membrane lipoprotein [Sphingobacterium faecale]